MARKFAYDAVCGYTYALTFNNAVEIAFSGIIHRDHQDFEEEIKEINRKLWNLCKDKGIMFINNNNIDS